MNTRLEIILEVNGIKYYLDTTGIETIPLTFNIANIKDISQTKGSFSKSIVIPETTNNRNIFNDISNLNSASDFNPNIRNRAYILVDSEMLIEGFFQLKEVSLDFGYGKNQMTLVVFTDNSDFYTVLGEDYLEELDLSRFDHLWNKQNIVYSWTQSYTHGYFYPLIDYGYDWDVRDINGTNNVPSVPDSGIVAINQIKPAIYARTIWDQIFTEAGFNWQSNSLTSETPFNNLIVPFNNKDILVSSLYVQLRTFKVLLSSDVDVRLKYWYVYNPGNYAFYPPYTQPASWIGTQTNLSTSLTFYQSGTLYNTATFSFNDDTTPPADDPNNLWNTTLFEYENKSNAPVTQRFGFNLNIEQAFYYASNNLPYVQLYRSRNPTTGATVSGGFKVNTCDSFLSANGEYRISTANGWQKTQNANFGYLGAQLGGPGPVIPPEYERYTAQFYSLPFQVFPGEKVWLTYTFPIAGKGGWDNLIFFGSGNPLLGLQANTRVASLLAGSQMFNEVSAVFNVDEVIEFNSVIPKKIKQKDFILSIIKMFNLVVEPSKDYPNTLIIETRDYYYRTGQIKNWSDKVNLNDAIDVQILGDSQNKRTILKYKDDKDFYNTDYVLQTGETYGEYQFIIDNEFCEGEKKMEVIFSPTPNVSLLENSNVVGSTASALIIPKIGSVNNNLFSYSAFNIRILQKNYLPVPSNSYWKLGNISDPVQTAYPYAGHMDNPYNPTFDINFGQTDGLYYPQTTTTNNNLFNAYWKSMLEELGDRESRIITCSMYLTAADIIGFRFNDNIYLDFGQGGQYYKVNKIENYDPSVIATCKVELVKTKNITVPRAKIEIIKPKSTKPDKITSVGSIRNNFIKGNNAVVLGSGNNVSDSGVVLGSGNNISGRDNLVSGNDNTILGDTSFVKGSNNIIDRTSSNTFVAGDNNSIIGTTDVKVIGNNNTIEPVYGATQSPTNVFVFGDGMTVNNSNSFNISGVLIVNNNYVQAGFDEILDRFSENSIINYIYGSRDEVRDFGSQVNISLVFAGRDTII